VHADRAIEALEQDFAQVLEAQALPMHSSATTFDTRHCSGCAWEQSRAASCTVDPNKS
jgi:hypothetical protein